MTLNVQNLDRLISHLEGLPEEKFDMRWVFSGQKGELYGLDEFQDCGTAACLAGWCIVLQGRSSIGSRNSAEWLGLDTYGYDALFMPDGFAFRGNFPLSRAIRTLKHMRSEFLRTGQVVVDWDAPEPVPRKGWAPPMAREQQLPIELTALLSTFDRVEVQS